MKKMIFLFYVHGLVTAVLFAEAVRTSEGIYDAEIAFLGQYEGKSLADNKMPILLNKKYKEYYAKKKLSKGDWECIRYMLNRYEPHSKGDTYFIVFTDSIISSNSTIQTWFGCEFTSNTEYTWWSYFGFLSDRR